MLLSPTPTKKCLKQQVPIIHVSIFPWEIHKLAVKIRDFSPPAPWRTFMACLKVSFRSATKQLPNFRFRGQYLPFTTFTVIFGVGGLRVYRQNKGFCHKDLWTTSLVWPEAEAFVFTLLTWRWHTPHSPSLVGGLEDFTNYTKSIT